MKYVIITVAVLYTAMAIAIFAMHTQMPVTFWLAFWRSVLWPVWIAGGLQGTPLPMD
jgi:uncharacterized integral membrane protein